MTKTLSLSKNKGYIQCTWGDCKMREAIILAGGEGWRLKPATWVPKPLLKINKKKRSLIIRLIGFVRTILRILLLHLIGRTSQKEPRHIFTGRRKPRNRWSYKKSFSAHQRQSCLCNERRRPSVL